MTHCDHTELLFKVSAHAKEAGYIQPTVQQRLAATQPSGRAPKASKRERSKIANVHGDIFADSTFPSPLVLPGDELSLDPRYPPQSFRSWLREKDRNAVTDERRTVYLVPSPEVGNGVDFLKAWTTPRSSLRADGPALEDVVAYLQAFYHGLPVKVLHEPRLRFSQWTDAKKPTKRSRSNEPPRVALETASEAIRITTRSSREFEGQLNLNDLLDVAITILPDDAYALLMLIPYDLYEDDEDDFCCGRAYGGSRVAVVSTARYNPSLDMRQGLDRSHVWPASHCTQYVEECCGLMTDGVPARKKQRLAQSEETVNDEASALSAAVAAHNAHPQPKTSSNETSSWLKTLWLGRVCKTASHELGHCFGIDHCTYYACIMQGTASILEDSRQPPYLCPVDAAKVLEATGADESGRSRALLAFCERFPDDAAFSAFAAWLKVRLDRK